MVRFRTSILVVTVFLALFISGSARCADFLKGWELTGYVETELRAFKAEPSFNGQDNRTGFSLAFQPELFREWSEGTSRFILTPFLRVDSLDSERTHFDLREMHYHYIGDPWELKFGVSKVFWGVTESQHLVDVINQTDGVENLDFEEKLGQPMLNFTWLPEWGNIDLFYLPFFRERTFPGTDGRLRFPSTVDTDHPEYEADWEQWDPSFAARWAHVIGDFDVGVYYFYGTSRDPLFRISPPGGPGSELIPVYNRMHQVGTELQWTQEGWLLKLETLARDGLGQHFQAAVPGFEYTFYSLLESSLDLGFLSEYHYDSRWGQALTTLNHDVFVGGRLTLNDEMDTAFLGGVLWDHVHGTATARIEFERRIGSRFSLGIEGQWFIESEPADLAYFFRNDSFLELELRRYF
ncbi:MAG TPA: hypothetical protein EYQ50_24775 [Verrucomicrobiales bacterium]|nr:hypothetical protein [Verrucomicrobiales bacterium]HIL70393.1 hypothetical protein [Verrucomicrobiota bacterium]